MPLYKPTVWPPHLEYWVQVWPPLLQIGHRWPGLPFLICQTHGHTAAGGTPSLLQSPQEGSSIPTGFCEPGTRYTFGLGLLKHQTDMFNSVPAEEGLCCSIRSPAYSKLHWLQAKIFSGQVLKAPWPFPLYPERSTLVLLSQVTQFFSALTLTPCYKTPTVAVEPF